MINILPGKGNISGMTFVSVVIWITLLSKPAKLNWMKKPNQPESGRMKAALYVILLPSWVFVRTVGEVVDSQITLKN